jgi:O-Antigen ligase
MEKSFRNWMLLFGAITAVSLVVFRMAQVETVVCAAILGVVFVLAIKRLEYGVLALIAEVFTSGNGRLLEVHAGAALVSLRMGLFVVVMLAWCIDVVRKRRAHVLLQERSIQAILLMLGVIVWGFVNGMLVRGLPVGKVIADGNGWLYFAMLLPIVDLMLRQERAQWLQRVRYLVHAGVVFICGKAWIIFLLTAGTGSTVATYLYHFVRQTSGGQIAPASYGMWRIYEWPQLLLIPALLYLVHQWIQENRPRAHHEYGMLFLLVATVVLTLFRSFWVGAIIGLGCVVLVHVGDRWRAAVRVSGMLLGMTLLSVLLIMGVGSGLAKLTGGTPTIQKEVFSASEPGVQNRIAQFRPLIERIREAPVLGSGFGTTVTYESTDLRAQGQFTTAALELGWLDMMMEVGVFGVAFYLACLWILVRRTQGWVFSAVVSLMSIHALSPFLNHPVGITLFAIIFVYSSDEINDSAVDTLPEKL